MNKFQKVAVGAGVAALAFGGSMLAAAPASAAPTTTLGSGCVGTGQGSLCIATVIFDNYQVSYSKTSGGTQTLDFNLYCTDGSWFGDAGAFTASSGDFKTYVFAIGNHGMCKGQLFDLGTGQEWDTGYVQP